MEKVASLVSKLFENKHLNLDLNFGRVNLQKLETVINEYGYSLDDIAPKTKTIYRLSRNNC